MRRQSLYLDWWGILGGNLLDGDPVRVPGGGVEGGALHGAAAQVIATLPAYINGT